MWLHLFAAGDVKVENREAEGGEHDEPEFEHNEASVPPLAAARQPPIGRSDRTPRRPSLRPSGGWHEGRQAAIIGAMLSLIFAAATLASATPAPLPSAPPPVSDPCGSILSIVNRPTVTTGVCTIRPHHVDVETGYTNTTTTGTGGGQTVQYPQAFVRIGTGDPHLEFNFSPPSSTLTSVGGARIGGANDINAGIKYELGYTQKALWGVNAQVSAASGSPAFTAGAPQYTLNANWGYAASGTLSLAGTFGFNELAERTPAGIGHAFAFVPSIELAVSLTPDSQAFVEYAYFTHAGVGLPARSFIDAGYERDLSPHLQIDLEYGIQPTPLLGARQHAIGAGLSFMN